ncbi:DNA glycosylase [Gaertneriomyces semiglobifer]|nr:DNA glycosylase [Gaertneriomyces semiglobifer]
MSTPCESPRRMSARQRSSGDNMAPSTPPRSSRRGVKRKYETEISTITIPTNELMRGAEMVTCKSLDEVVVTGSPPATPARRRSVRLKEKHKATTDSTSSHTRVKKEADGSTVSVTSQQRIPPPMSDTEYGLIQETLRDNPFHLLISTIFLTKTRGSFTRPFLFTFLSKYPTPLALCPASAEERTVLFAEISTFLTPLGLQNVKTRRILNLAQSYINDPPVPGLLRPPRDKLYGMQTEIGHLKGVGRYAYDSWRIFCKDRWLGKEESEWRSVEPWDKELKKYMEWRWEKKRRPDMKT